MPSLGQLDSLIMSQMAAHGPSLDRALSYASTSATGSAPSSGSSLTLASLESLMQRVSGLSTGRSFDPWPLERDDFGDAMRYSRNVRSAADFMRMHTCDYIAGRSADFYITDESSTISTIPTSIPERNKMNELLDSLETMIRRVVVEEIAKVPVAQAVAVSMDSFAAQLRAYAASRPTEFSQLTKDAVLDQGWFDDAITAQVLAKADEDPSFEDQFKSMNNNSYALTNAMLNCTDGSTISHAIRVEAEAAFEGEAFERCVTAVLKTLPVTLNVG